MALSLPADAILLDDEEARGTAKLLGVHAKGSLGLLVEYKRAGRMDEKRALGVLERLNEVTYLSGDLYHQVERLLRE
ncbi:MAG: hypothetical protein Kow0069_38330 [Promethearchaeota archaeon]